MNYCESFCRTIQRLCNSGTLLPAEYQQVEYLASSGTQYINTGVVVDSLYNLQYKISYYKIANAANYGRVCGSYSGFGGGSTCIVWDTGTLEHGSVQKQLVTTSVGNRYDVAIVTNNSQYSFVTNETTAAGNITGNYGNQPFFVFTLAHATVNPTQYMSKIRVYSCSMAKGETPVFNLIPCYRKSDNKPGMYDLVSNTFYTNSGSGEFTVGADVN